MNAQHRRHIGWVGNLNTLNQSDPFLEELRQQFDSGEKTAQMARFERFEDWIGSCVTMTSRAIIRMMKDDEAEGAPLNQSRILKQVEFNKRAAANPRLYFAGKLK